MVESNRVLIDASANGPLTGMMKESPESGAAAFDSALAALHVEPFVVVEPAARVAPFVFASPHSGRLYPRTFLNQSQLSPLTLRRSEDAYVDELFGDVVQFGAPLIVARFPRAYVDANRAPGELDQAMFQGPLSGPIDQASARVNAGLGVIPRIVRDGAEIYRGKLPASEAEDRLSRLHRRYHAALSSLVQETRARFDAVVVIDCHSMPSTAGTPDIVLGDRYGTAASPVLLRKAEELFQSRGFTVGRNVPYAGGYTTHLYGEPVRGTHALQVEVNRSLYLDEDRLEVTAGYSELRRRLLSVFGELVGIHLDVLRPQGGIRFAAE
ncbi:MAG TPA: N-formylglutamate amidohydrolase [Rhizomicrobium sp.]|jgi:N-formylglutamate deformylase|nr:N-formylglutamate amidohydrolase [Rhizomicrobium sp.]